MSLRQMVSASLRSSVWREPGLVAGLALLGIVCGVAAKVADESQIRWVGDAGTYPAIWVLALALIGRFAPSTGWAAMRAAAFFLATCLAYFVWSWFVLGFDVDRYPLLWMGLAVSAVPVIAAGMCWASVRAGSLPSLIVSTVAAVAIADANVWQLWWAWVLREAPEGFPLRPFQALLGVAVAVTVASVLPRHGQTCLLSAILLVPVAIIVYRVVDGVMGVLLGLV